MPTYALDGASPRVHPGAFVAPTAVLVGDVVVESGASVWFNAVLRADHSRIVVREGANVQDCSVLHGPPDLVTEIGPRATVGHQCVVHGAVIGEDALIGNGSTVLDGARIGAGCLVAAHSMVAAGARFEPGMLVAGSPAVAKRPIAGTQAERWVQVNPGAYGALAERYLQELKQLD
ncbi:gamma carbonic anhydrase family protein [Streptomyces sp. NY05-11A]|uniref:gamma carbonic anhydrase family protein n=1 Tax=Streptomyces soliscabiei TaxID=588897 RepID=UPI0029A4E678|nr:gamma carbonic anhydrase family protein [Streptomyces sp. NY05-11A]MDX2675072.1 gamma carbonic anhydrase family protein [Streptomyces sp. NY05-11A]